MLEAPRLFYTEPLAAEWAAKRHGMRFQVRMIGDLFHDIDNPREWHPDYFIHPECAPLLDCFTAEEKAAMQLLGLWPKEV